MKKWELVTAGLALCVNPLTPLAALGAEDEVSAGQRAKVEEMPAIALLAVRNQTELVLRGIYPLAMELRAAPELAPDTETAPAAERVPRYAGVSMSEDERRELAAIIYLESANQCAGGQQAVAEVVLNRVISPDFPNTVHDVLHEGEGTPVPQFSTIVKLDSAEPSAAQYAAIDAALYGPSILPEDVVFFSRYGENDRIWGKIQDHVFCYAYIWE